MCVIGPNFLLQFSSLSAQLPALACCSLVKQTHLKSASWMAVGGSVQACVKNYSVTFMLGAHMAATSLNYCTVFLHISLVLDGFKLYITALLYAAILQHSLQNDTKTTICGFTGSKKCSDCVLLPEVLLSQ